MKAGDCTDAKAADIDRCHKVCMRVTDKTPQERIQAYTDSLLSVNIAIGIIVATRVIMSLWQGPFCSRLDVKARELCEFFVLALEPKSHRATRAEIAERERTRAERNRQSNDAVDESGI